MKVSLKTAVILIMMLNAMMSKSFSQSKIRVTGYYAGWMQGWYNNGRLPSDKIDYSSVDYIIHFALFPRKDGTVNYTSNSILETNSKPLIDEAHANGKKVIISIGGWGSDVYFREATSADSIINFVNNITSFVNERGYDGVDIDWEILNLSDSTQYSNFIKLLSSELHKTNPDAILTAAAAWNPSIIASLQDYFDQINIMTYDLSGAWPGWVSWFNAPVYSTGKFQSNGRTYPSADLLVDEFIAAGVQKEKIAIGIDFYGYIWKGGSGTQTGGVTLPRQSWTTAPRVSANIPYYSIMDKYFETGRYRWDSTAQASYLQIDDSCNGNDMFISYDDARLCKAKVEYARTKGIGGVFIWELGAGVYSSSIYDEQSLIKTTAAAARGDQIIPSSPYIASPQIDTLKLPAFLSWYPAVFAESYSVQVSEDPNFGLLSFDTTVYTRTSVKLNNLDKNKKYFWRISANNEFGSSGFSDAKEIYTTDKSLWAPVLNLPPDNGISLANNVLFKWKVNSKMYLYNLQITSSNDFCNPDIDTVIVKDSICVIGKLNGNTTYYWRVKSTPENYSNDDQIAYSEIREFSTKGQLPDIPLVLSPVNGSDNISTHPVLRWSSTPFANTYSVRISQNSEFNSNTKNITGITDTYLKIDSLSNSRKYYWQVSAFNISGISGWSSTAEFVTAPSDKFSFYDGDTITAFKLNQNYPNPFNLNTMIRFDVPVQSSVHLVVYNVLGQNEGEANFENLGPGIYEYSFNADRLASGIYFYAIKATSSADGGKELFFKTKKMLLVK